MKRKVKYDVCIFILISVFCFIYYLPFVYIERFNTNEVILYDNIITHLIFNIYFIPIFLGSFLGNRFYRMKADKKSIDYNYYTFLYTLGSGALGFLISLIFLFIGVYIYDCILGLFLKDPFWMDTRYLSSISYEEIPRFVLCLILSVIIIILIYQIKVDKYVKCFKDKETDAKNSETQNTEDKNL